MKDLFESPLFQKISRLADFFLASLLWMICSLPVITIVPATAALYHATVKIVRYHAADSTVKSFFKSFRGNLLQGMGLSVLYILAAVILYTFVDVANGFGWQSLYSRVYLVLTVLYSLALVFITLLLIPIVSRFQIGTLAAIRLSLQKIPENLMKLIPYTIALVGIVGICYIIPPLILVLPSGFCFSLSTVTEPMLNAFMEENTDETMEIPEWLDGDNG